MSNMEYELTSEQLQLVRNWSKFDKMITTFKNKANLSLFQEVYGSAEGNRLIDHFVNGCNRDFKEFLTYLTVTQHNKTLEYILNTYE